MALSVIAWNTNEKLGHPDFSVAAKEHLKRGIADTTGSVVVLSEVCREKPADPDEVREDLAEFAGSLGFRQYWAEYDDKIPRANQPEGLKQHLAVWSNLPVLGGGVVRLATRNAISLDVSHENEVVSITGAHLDERRPDTRTQQLLHYLRLASLTENESQLDVLAGDLNISRSIRTRLLRGLRHVAGLTGTPPEGPGEIASWLDSIKYADSVLKRASSFAHPWPFKMLAELGYLDADPAGRATHLLGQLDHIFYRLKTSANASGLTFKRGKKGPSDHRLIQASLRW